MDVIIPRIKRPNRNENGSSQNAPAGNDAKEANEESHDVTGDAASLGKYRGKSLLGRVALVTS